MGFLKFLKRGKGNEPDFELGDLDIPPPPPDLNKEDFTGHAELPKMPEAKEPFSEAEEKPFFGGRFPGEKYGPGPETRPMPEFPKLKEGIKVPEPIPHPKPLFGAQPKPIFEKIKPKEGPKLEVPKAAIPGTTLYREGKPDFKEYDETAIKRKEMGGPIFIRVDKFRDLITKINTMKNDLKIAVRSIGELNDANLSMEKVFGSWEGIMSDLQKKLVFVDDTLFKR